MSESADVIDWVSQSPYCKALGIEPQIVGSDRVLLRLPFKLENANTGGALHGGIAASLGLTAGQAIARAAMGPESGPWHTVSVQINYLAAGMNEAVEVESVLLSRGKTLCFTQINVRSETGKMIASIVSMVRGRAGSAAAEPARRTIDTPTHGDAPLRERMEANPFIASRGMKLPYQENGACLMTMPWREQNGTADGHVHEGAVASLLDTTGAMASWSLTGAGPFRASTPSLQAQMLMPVPAIDLEARGRVVYRDQEMFWVDVEVSGAADANVYARGTVAYRILT